MRKKAFAKINLCLEVLNKRDDGYHNIKSLFARIDLHDNLIFEKRKDREINITVKNNVNAFNIEFKSNLVYKAAERFINEFSIDCGVDIVLEKNIPIGAGLGGGSSDCASTLLGLSEIFEIDDKDRLFNISKEIGSDVMFFMKDCKFALCEGRGEMVNPVDVKAKLPYIILVFPDINMSTKKVYETMSCDYKTNKEKINNLLAELGKKSEIDFSKYLFNRLENAIFKINSEVRELKNKIESFSIPSLMSGSGSSVFGISYDLNKISSAFNKLKKSYNFVYISKIV